MRRLTFLLSLWVFLPIITNATTAFEVSSDTASRTSLELNGGYVEDIAISPSGTVWAGLNSPNGLYYLKSDDTWQGVPAGSDFGNIASVDVSTDTVMFVGGIKLFRSQDNGSTWNELTNVVDLASEIHYGQNKWFVALRDGTLAISTDNGTTFNTVSLATSVIEVISVATTTSGTTVYALAQTSETEEQLFKSTDGGSTWVNTGKTFGYVSSSEIKIKPTDDNFLVVRDIDSVDYSTNAGVNWQTLTTDKVGGVAVSTSRIYAGTRYTEDLGNNWTDINSGSASSLKSDKIIALDPADNNKIYTHSMVGIIRSTDAAANWQDINYGLSGVTINDYAQSDDLQTVWLAAHGGLAKTTNFLDAAPSWVFPIKANSDIDYATAVWLDTADVNYVVAAMGDNIYYSADAGVNWTQATLSISDANITDFLENDNKLFAGYNNGVLLSIDNGQTWSTTAMSGAFVNNLVADSSGNIYAGCGSEDNTATSTRGIYKYNGITWSQITGSTSQYLINDITIAGNNIFAVAGETDKGAVFKSNDAGATWQNLTGNGLASDGWYHAVIAESGSAKNLYVSTARPAGTGYIYKSTDAGDTWNLFYTGLTDEEFNIMFYANTAAVVSSNSNKINSYKKSVGLITGTNTGIYQVYSKANLSIKASKYNIKKGANVTITSVLKDKTTSKYLKNRTIRLYKKNKANNDWNYIKKSSTNSLGKVTFTVNPLKNVYYRVRWSTVAKTADKKNYGTTSFYSSNLYIKVK